MAITTEEKYILNRMNAKAFKTQLGTLIESAESAGGSLTEGSVFIGNSSNIAAELDCSGDTKILIGNATTLTSVAMSGDATLSNTGVLTIGAGKIDPGMTAIATGSILLGTAAVGAELDCSGDAKILVGNGTTMTSVSVSGDITIDNTGDATIGAGVVESSMIADGAITASKLASSGSYDLFDTPVMQMQNDGTAVDGGAGSVNILNTGSENYEWSVLGAGQAIAYLTWGANGLNIAQDQAEDDGIELTQGITARSKVAYTVGTDRFYIESRLKLSDVSGTDDCLIGFRKAEAYQANVDDYDEAAFINVNAGDVILETILNDGGTTSTDTTDKVTADQYIDMRVEVDHIAGLAGAITLANELKSKYNTHCGSALAEAVALANDLKAKWNTHIDDVTAHTNDDDASLVTAADSTDDGNGTSLIALLTDMLLKYDNHDGDAELAANWAWHIAQESGDHSVASTAAPTTIAHCVTDVNDLLTVMAAHIADVTAHNTAGTSSSLTAVTAAHENLDAANLSTAADATNLATLIVLISDIQDTYDVHDDDAELGSSWLYHEAQEGGNASPDTTTPTDLPTSVAQLNLLKTALDTHFADTTSHNVASTAVVAAGAANVFFKIGLNGAAIAAPTVTAAFAFDDGEVVVPFLFFLHTGDFMDTLYLQKWDVGLLS